MKSHQFTKLIPFLMSATTANTQTVVDNLINQILTETKEMPYNPDTDLTTPEIAIRHGYPAEAHTVTTQDGYLLTMHRIPCGQAGCQTKGGRGRGQPVFLQHGLLSSSADWVISGPGKALAYILADAGYDVWLGNARGNSYSRRHVSMSNENSKFWDFSWHEMAMYDIPAEIDYIYDIKDERNSSNDLLYIGHSMGTTIAFVLLGSRPEYNNKILAAFALAPVAYMSHVKSPLRLLDFEPNTNYNIEIPLKYLTKLRIPNWVDIITNRILNHVSLRVQRAQLKIIVKYFGSNEFLPHSEITKFLTKFGCDLIEVERYICENTLYLLSGYDQTQTLMPVIFGHTPAGTSTKTVVHYTQEIKDNGNFQQFDYGKIENLRRYGYEKPPLYNISNIVTPFAFFYAQNDWVTGPSDVERLFKSLQSTAIGLFKVPTNRFKHVDFVYGIDAPKLVYMKLMELLGRFH